MRRSQLQLVCGPGALRLRGDPVNVLMVSETIDRPERDFGSAERAIDVEMIADFSNPLRFRRKQLTTDRSPDFTGIYPYQVAYTRTVVNKVRASSGHPSIIRLVHGRFWLPF